MATIQINLTCELQEAVKVRYLDGNLFSQDNQGNQINVTVFDNGEPATLGGSVTANVLLSDGSTVPATGGTITGNVVSITLPAAAYAVPGLASIIVKVTADGVITTIAAVVANVYQSSTDTVIDPGTIIPSVQDLIDDIETAVATIPADYSTLWTTLAPAYSNTATYAVNQYVTHNGVLYRCTTAVTTAGDWSTNSGNFATANIGNDLGDLKSAVDVMEDYQFTWEEAGHYISESGEPSTSTSSVYTYSGLIQVIPGTKIRVRTKIHGHASICAFGADGTTFTGQYVKNESGGSAVLKDYIFTLGDDAHYIKASCYVNATQNFSVTQSIIPEMFDIIDDLHAVETELNNVTENTVNLWSYGDVSGTKLANKQFSFTEGKQYTFSAKIVSEDKTHAKSRLSFNDSGSHEISYVLLDHDGTRQSYTFTAPANVARIYFYASQTSSASTDKAFTFSDIQIVEGPAIPYVPYGKTGIDHVARSIIEETPLTGKIVAIIGDSISTNGHWSVLNPSGNMPEIIIQEGDVGVQLSAYVTLLDVYTTTSKTTLTGLTIGGHTFTESEIGTEVSFTPTAEDVGKFIGKPVNKNDSQIVTWWEVAQEKMGFIAIPVCWSGSSITSHEASSDLFKTSYAWHPAQIRKCGIRIASKSSAASDRIPPDMVIIYRGTNDFSHSPYSKLTQDYFGYPWTYPETDELQGGGYGYKEGLCLTIRKIREAYPLAKVVLCTCNFFKRNNYTTYPVNNGQYTENQLNNAIREVANWMGCGLIEFDRDGLTFENASSTYYSDDAAYTHPTTAGQKIMGDRAIQDLMRINCIDQ